jgi:beta-xylosidase
MLFGHLHYTVLAFLPALLHGSPGPVVRPARRAAVQPVIHVDFPDPSIIQDFDGTWYAFATSGNDRNIQVARSPSPSGPWTVLAQDALPFSGLWTTGSNNWAPDVRKIAPGRYVMFYSGQVGDNTEFHCVGRAVSNVVQGPYVPDPRGPLACPLDQGGAIDPAGYFDEETGTRWVVYKM